METPEGRDANFNTVLQPEYLEYEKTLLDLRSFHRAVSDDDVGKKNGRELRGELSGSPFQTKKKRTLYMSYTQCLYF